MLIQIEIRIIGLCMYGKHEEYGYKYQDIIKTFKNQNHMKKKIFCNNQSHAYIHIGEKTPTVEYRHLCDDEIISKGIILGSLQDKDSYKSNMSKPYCLMNSDLFHTALCYVLLTKCLSGYN